MGCNSNVCGTKGCANSGSCSNCGTMNVHDWLQDMTEPGKPFDIVEVRFKNGRKDYYRNENNLDLSNGDTVVVETSPGHHLGEVTMKGELVKLQLKRKGINLDDHFKIIYRSAGKRDLEKFDTARDRELTTLYKTREIIKRLELNMKLTDVEFQADNTKATFFYSAEERVDFRDLIKELAAQFKIRVEMRQISLRQEASRLGGIGSCGRELCCSTWLTEFKSVSTSAARYQNLSLNPSKLSGQCGRLKCCLNYELDTYLEELEDIPKVEKPLDTDKGPAFLQKTDIFKKIMWFGYANENSWYPLTLDRVQHIQKLNSKGKKVFSLEEDVEKKDVVAQAINTELDKLDSKFKKSGGGNKRKKKRKKKPRRDQNKK